MHRRFRFHLWVSDGVLVRVGQLCDIVAWEREEVGVSVALRCIGRCEIGGEERHYRGSLEFASTALHRPLKIHQSLQHCCVYPWATPAATMFAPDKERAGVVARWRPYLLAFNRTQAAE